jgi:hypothetical protein
MFKTFFAAMLAVLLSGSAMAQTSPTPDQIASLVWMHGERVHTNPNGTLVYEAFLGPVSGVVTGTALTSIGADRAYTEYHRIGPNAEGVYGLDVANTRSGMKWNFTPLKAIEPGRIIFETADHSLMIMYYSEPGGGIGSRVDRVGADGKTTTQEWRFKAVPAPK